MNTDQLPAKQLRDINWGALDHTSRAPQFMPCNCVCACVWAHIHVRIYADVPNVCTTYSIIILDFNFIEDE